MAAQVSCAAQATIIIPFYKQGENKQFIIEEDPCYRKVETKIKEAALKEVDLQLIDYLALVRKIGKDQIRNIGSETDLIKKLVQESDPDIYVVADIEQYSGQPSGSGKTEYAFRINLTAHQSNTGRTVAATILDSGFRYYEDCQSLIEKAFTETDEKNLRKIEVFLQMLTTKVIPTLSIEFIVESGSDSKYTRKISNGKLLTQEIVQWIRENSDNKKASAKTNTVYISFREVLMPKREDLNYEYTVSDYALDFYSYLTELSFSGSDKNLEFDFDVAGNVITFKLK